MQVRPPVIPVIGASTVAQLDEMLGAVDLCLDEDVRKVWTRQATAPTSDRRGSSALASPGGARESGSRIESYTRVSDHLNPTF